MNSNHKKRIELEQNNDKDGKVLIKLINNAIYRKIMENVRNRVNLKLIKNKKDHLKRTSKPSYLSHKIFDINLVTMRNSRLALKLNKLAYIGMCILDLSIVWFHEMFDFSNYSTKSKYYNN